MVPHLRTALAVLLLSAGTLPVSAQSAQGAAPAKRPDPTDARATVPPVVHVTVTVRELPESASGAKVQVAVPLFEKSSTATPVTASENVSV